MSKNTKYFDKLNKLKKGVTYESSKKLEDKEQSLTEKLEELEIELLLVKEELKIAQSKAAMERQTADAISEALEKSLQFKESKAKSLVQLQDDIEKIITKKNTLEVMFNNSNTDLIKCVKVLHAYSKGEHISKGFMGKDKVGDKGEMATECLRQLSSISTADFEQKKEPQNLPTEEKE